MADTFGRGGDSARGTGDDTRGCSVGLAHSDVGAGARAAGAAP
jgi:hypothetical protein